MHDCSLSFLNFLICRAKYIWEHYYKPGRVIGTIAQKESHPGKKRKAKINSLGFVKSSFFKHRSRRSQDNKSVKDEFQRYAIS